MFPMLGLKASSDPAQIMDRLRHRPEVFEFFTDVPDFTPEGLNHLKKMIGLVQSQGIQHIVLHQPMKFQGHHTELITPEKVFPELYDFVHRTAVTLIEVAQELGVQALIHGSYDSEHGFDEMLAYYPDLASARKLNFQMLDRLQAIGGEHVMFENSISPIFFYGDPEVEQTILDHHYRLVCDVSHAFISVHGDNDKLVASLNHVKPAIVHYHLVDSMGEHHDSLILGTGKIDWRRVLPLLNENSKATSIYEINLADPTDAKEQMESHRYLVELAKTLTD